MPSAPRPAPPRSQHPRRPARSALLSLALLGFALFGLQAAPFASAVAGEYEVHPCFGHTETSIFTAKFPADGNSIFANNLCAVPRAVISLEGLRSPTPATNENASWFFLVPPFLEVKRVQMFQEFAGNWEPSQANLAWLVFVGSDELPNHRELIEETGHFETKNVPVPPTGPLEYRVGSGAKGSRTFPAGTHLFEERLECTVKVLGCEGGPLATTTANLTVRLADATPPTFEFVAGSLFDADKVSGTAEVVAGGSDLQTGAFLAKVLVDGEEVASGAPDDLNGGQCQKPFEAFVPCKQVGTFHIKVPTGDIKDGDHDNVRVLVCDATATNCAESQAKHITVANAPQNEAKPSIAGAANVGSKLTANPGKWNEILKGAFSFQWLRCPAGVADPGQCLEIPGATGSTYTPASADLGRSLIVRVQNTVIGAGKASSAAVSAPTAQVAGAAARTPRARIVKHPQARAHAALARFAFSSDPPGLSFQCKLDKRAFKACGASFKVKVKPGAHVLEVRAVDAAGASSAETSFRWRFTPKRRHRGHRR